MKDNGLRSGLPRLVSFFLSLFQINPTDFVWLIAHGIKSWKEHRLPSYNQSRLKNSPPSAWNLHIVQQHKIKLGSSTVTLDGTQVENETV